MKTNYSLFNILLLLLFISMFSACSDDDSIEILQPSAIEGIRIKKEYFIKMNEVLTITPTSDNLEASFEWTVNNAEFGIKDSVASRQLTINFIEQRVGIYELTFTVQMADSEKHAFKTTVNVVSGVEYSPYITKVFDFLPSVGQFTNILPLAYEESDTRETMIKKAEVALMGNKVISLGGYGGYVTFGFDHTILNVPGKRDFRVMGNADINTSEPGIIMVAYDKNKNGKPDEDEWYEIAGSEHVAKRVIYNYEITFYEPKLELPGPLKEYIRWKDNQGGEGYKEKNVFHDQSYYPNWIKAEELTFRGTLLPNNAEKKNGMWVLNAFEYGYADNYPNSSDGSAIDIDWAVDKQGNKANLPGIDFVKVYSGLNQEAGEIGETSTEVAGACDLHLLGISIVTR